MSARRDGQQNAAASESVTKTDFMLKIMTAMPASTATATATTTVAAAAMPTATSTSATTVNVQNKCATAAPTTFSYQRAAKRCARLPQTTQEANNAATSPTTTTVTESITDSATTTTTVAPTTTAALSLNSCERQRRLAAHKAQLRAAFFKDLNALALQQQQQQQREPREQLREPASTQSIQQLIEKFETMIVQQPTEPRSNEAQTQMQMQTETQTQVEAQQSTSLLLKPSTILSSIANSDEGCNAGGLSPCSSDNECDAAVTARLSKPKVTRCASSDSALGLEVDDVTMAEMPPAMPQRRMTLTVTDLPLRPALLPLAEPTALPDSPLTSPTNATATTLTTTTSTLTPTSIAAGVGAGANAGVPSKVLLEERVVAAPPSSRRESTQSCISELGGLVGVRYVRTPSVVVSDYSDDITACGISMEEMEYFRLQRARCQRRCSLEASAAAAGGIGGAKDEAQSDVSAASSCSNLYYCGSTISALDGGECIVNGVLVALARKSSHSSSGELSDEELPSAADAEADAEAEAEEEAELQQQKQQQQQQLERERERERQLSELLAATQLGEGFKKVGSDGANNGADGRSSRKQQEGSGGDKGKVTIMGNLK